jgi:hypothetical protein
MNNKKRTLHPPIWIIIAAVLEPGLDSVARSLFFSARVFFVPATFIMAADEVIPI